MVDRDDDGGDLGLADQAADAPLEPNLLLVLIHFAWKYEEEALV